MMFKWLVDLFGSESGPYKGYVEGTKPCPTIPPAPAHPPASGKPAPGPLESVTRGSALRPDGGYQPKVDPLLKHPPRGGSAVRRDGSVKGQAVAPATKPSGPPPRPEGRKNTHVGEKGHQHPGGGIPKIDATPNQWEREERAYAPHCDQSVLHAPSKCQWCDQYPDWQELRERWRINFTGENDPTKAPCPATHFRSVDTINKWGGNRPYIETDLDRRAREMLGKQVKLKTTGQVLGEFTYWDGEKALIWDGGDVPEMPIHYIHELELA